MADGTVDMKFTGSAQDLERAIDRLEKKYSALEGKMKSVQRTGRAKSTDMMQQMAQWAAGVATVGTAYSAISAGIKKAISLQDELIKKADEFGNKQDRRQRSFGVNAGITPEQAGIADASMRNVAKATGVPLQNVEQAASGLVGAGFDWRAASGPALQKLLEMQATTGGGDPGELSGQIASALQSQGLKQSPENIERIARTIWATRKAGNVEADSIQFLARKLSTSKSSQWEENLALFTNLMDVSGGSAETAATAFGNMEAVMRAPTKKQRAILAKIGADPAKLDMIGENKGDAIKYLSGVIGKLPDEGAGGKIDTLKNLFGKEFTGMTKHVLDRPERYQELLAAQGNAAGYRGAVDLALGGSGNMEEKLKVMEETQFAGKRSDVSNVLKLAEIKARERGESEFGIWANRQAADWTRWMGGSGENALSMMMPHPDDQMAVMQQARATTNAPLVGFGKEWTEALERNTVAVEKQNALMEAQKPKRAGAAPKD